MAGKDPNITDQILDLLLDALLERQRAIQGDEKALDALEVSDAPKAAGKIVPAGEPEPTAVASQATPDVTDLVQAQDNQSDPDFPLSDPAGELPETREEDQHLAPLTGHAPLPSIDLDRMLVRLAVALALLIILINIPYNRFGTSLARAMPDSAALIIRDGLLLKGSGERVYVLQDNQRRWISSLDAFSDRGYRWEQVHIVDDAFLNEFEEGTPIHILLKCTTSPHIYALEDGHKRWIKDIPTFEARGYVWEDVRFVSCDYLRDLPQGVPLPADAGPPPEP